MKIVKHKNRDFVIFDFSGAISPLGRNPFGQQKKINTIWKHPEL